MNFRQWLEAQEEYDDWENEVEAARGLPQVMATLRKWKAIDIRFSDYLVKKVLLFNINQEPHVITDLNNPDPQTAEEFMQDLSWSDRRHWEYLPENNFSQEFWRGVTKGSVIYHGTNDEGWKGIQEEGHIGCRDRTRGMSNRSVGCAVFLSFSHESTEYHYDITLQIDLGSMKAEGYMPEVEREPDIEESEALGSIAHDIGLEDWEPEVEQGIDYDTIIMHGDIPIKYIQNLSN